MKMPNWRLYLWTCFLSSVICFDCPSDRCHIRDEVLDCSHQKLSCIPCIGVTTPILNLAFNSIRSLNPDDFHCFQNLKSIDLSNNLITNIADMTFRNITEESKISLRFLNLKYNKLTTIQGKPFEGLINLQKLDLSFNLIHTIASKSFRGLPKLLDLKLRNNSLTSLNSGDFDGLINLQTLDVGNNAITVLDSTPFQGLDNLQELILDHNSLTFISNTAFKSKKASENSLLISSLDLSYNKINSFDDFAVLKELKILMLTGNNILELKEGSLNCLKLEQLYLQSNKLVDVKNGAFKLLGQLLELFMNDNVLEAVNRQMFEGLLNLQTLEVSNNRIKTLGINAFENLIRLKNLRIDHNQISTLKTQPFNNLRKLQSLDLSYNNIENIGNNSFSNCSKLEDLKLNDNRLTTITRNEFGKTMFTELQSLDLSNNYIESIGNTSLLGMKNIRYLHLDNNYIPQLPSNTFKEFNRLQFLYLQHNELIDISENTFIGLQGLQYLDLSFNKLLTIKSKTFEDNLALKTLSINKNQIRTLGNTTFSSLIYLNALYAEGNMIDKILGVNFGRLSRLKILNLDQNAISLVEESALSGLTSLMKLHLRSNKLKYFPSQVLRGLHQLKIVDISDNQIVSLHAPSSNQSFQLSLTGNQFSCDCALKSLKQWLSKSGNTQSLVCSQPKRLRGDNIFELKLETFQCISPSFSKISRDMRVEVGSDAKLFCEVEGFPEPVVKWFNSRNIEIGALHNDDERYDIDPSGILNIRNVSLNDAGVYTCLATNPGGTKDGKILLNVVEKDGSKAGVIGGGLFAIILVVGIGFGLYMYLWSYKRKREFVNTTQEDNDQAYMSISIDGFPTEREGGSQGSIHSEVVYATIGAGITGGNKSNEKEKEEHNYQPIWKPSDDSTDKEQLKKPKALHSRKPGSPGYMTMLPMNGDNGNEQDAQPSSSTLGTPKFIKNNVRKTVSARFESRFPKPKDKLQTELKLISKVATLRSQREKTVKDTNDEKTKAPIPIYSFPEGNIKRHVQQFENKIKKKEEEERPGVEKSCTMPRLRVDSAGSRAKEPITVGSNRPRTGSASKIEFSNKMYDSVVK